MLELLGSALERSGLRKRQPVRRCVPANGSILDLREARCPGGGRGERAASLRKAKCSDPGPHFRRAVASSSVRSHTQRCELCDASKINRYVRQGTDARSLNGQSAVLIPHFRKTGATMKINFSTSLLALALAMGASGCDRESGNAMSSDRHDATSMSNHADHCSTLAGNAKDICEKEADGRKWVEAAEFAAKQEPSAQHTYDLRIAKADAEISVAKERCDDLSGNPEDVCRQEAERAFETAKAEATLQLKLSDADAVARRTTNEANREAAEI